jgi:hypothetical protein
MDACIPILSNVAGAAADMRSRVRLIIINISIFFMNTLQKPQLPKYSVLGKFLTGTIYIVHPFNNHIRFYNVWPNIPNSRAIVEFLKGNGKYPNGDFLLVFTAECEIENDNLMVKRSNFGQTWQTSIPLSSIEKDSNFL